MLDALAGFAIDGVGATLPFLKFAIGHPAFARGQVNTGLVDKLLGEMTAQRDELRSRSA